MTRIESAHEKYNVFGLQDESEVSDVTISQI